MTNNLLRISYIKLTFLLVLILTANYSFASTESVDCDLSCNKKIIRNKFKSDMPPPTFKDFSNILALSEDELNYSVMKWAIYTDNAPLVDALFKFGVPVNLTISRMKTTFLMLAARKANPNIIQLILDHGGLPNLLDADGSTAIENIYFSTSMKIDERHKNGKKVSDKFLLRKKNIPLVIKKLLPVTTVLDPQLTTYISSYAEDYTDEKSILIEDYIACKEDEELFLPYEDIQKLIALKTKQVKSKTVLINSITSQFKSTISEKTINKVNLNHEKVLTALSNIKTVSKNDKVRFYAYVYQLDDAWYDFNSSFSSLERMVVKDVTVQLNNIKKGDSLTSSQLEERFNKVSSIAITPKTMQKVIEFYAERKEWPKADLVINKYIAFIKATNDQQLGSLFKKLSRAYQSNKNYSDQIDIENKRLSLILNLEGEGSENLASSYEKIGYAKYRLKEYDNAISSYEKAIKLTTKDKDKAYIYTQMGWVYGANKSYLKRIQIEQKRIDIIKKLESENSTELASSYENIAYAKYRLGDDTAAIQFYEKALPIRTKPEDKAKIYKQLGWAHKSSKNYDKLMDALVKRYEVLVDESNPTSNDELDTFFNDFLDALPKVELANQKVHFERILRLTESQSERIKLFKKGEYKVSWVDNPESYVFLMELYISELTDNKLLLRGNLKDLNLLSLGNAYAKIGNEKLALKYLALNYEYADNKNSESFIIYSKYTESISERMKCIEAIEPNNALLDSNDDDIELERCMKLGWKYVYGKVIEQLKIDSKKYKERFSINRRIRNLAITQHNLMFKILNRKYASVKASLNRINDNNIAKASHSQLVEVEKKLENFDSYTYKFSAWVSKSVLKDDEKIKKTISDNRQSHWTLKMFIYDYNKLKEKY